MLGLPATQGLSNNDDSAGRAMPDELRKCITIPGLLALLDHLIEKMEGRPVPQEELERVKAKIAQALRRISVAR
jgi:hypothetical protein